MKVRALIEFEDYLEHETRKQGDVFEVTKERFDEILTKGGPWVELVEDDVEEDVEEENETKKTKKGKA